MTVELVVLAPLLVLFMLITVSFGRVERARQEVVAAARAGAEAASVMPSAGQAGIVASKAALPSIVDQQFTCHPFEVSTDTSNFRPGGSVAVSVSCSVNLSNLLVPGFPGSVSISASRSAPVDPYRVVQEG
jgi:Flp pilus assembly protein TadG